MSNIPRGFRQAALAFEAQIPGGAGFQLSTTGVINPQGLPVTSSDSLTTLTDVLKGLKPGPTIIEKIEIAGRHESLEELYDKSWRSPGAAARQVIRTHSGEDGDTPHHRIATPAPAPAAQSGS